MHFWDLTIDVISCNTLVISIGLCVDFSAHIAHGFLSRSAIYSYDIFISR